MIADKKRVLKQFEWFQVQTKVRQIISEILDPFQKKLHLNTVAISKIQTHNENQKTKVEHLTLMVDNDPNIFDHGVFAKVDTQIVQCNSHIQELQQKIHFLQQFISKKIEVLDSRLEQSSQVLQSLGSFKQYMKKQLDNQNDKLIQSQQNIFSNFDSINQDITTVKVHLDGINSHNEVVSLKMQAVQKEIDAATARLTADLNSFNDLIKQTQLKQQFSQRDITELQEQIKRVDKFQHHVKQLQSHINQLSLTIDKLQYKLEVIHPIIGLTQINQYARHILPPEFHNNIEIYYHNRYGKMIEDIINNEIDLERVTHSRKGNLDLIKQVHKRSLKSVFKQKKAKLLEQGIDLDSQTYDKKEELLKNLELHEQFRTNSRQEEEAKKKQQSKKTNDVDFTQQFQKLEFTLLQKINAQLKDSKEYVIQMDQMTRRQIQDMSKTLYEIEKVYNDLKMNSTLQQKFGKQLQKSVKKSLVDMQGQISHFQKCLRDMHEVMSVYHQIQKQDEKDREAIALVGVRQHHRDQIKEQREPFGTKLGRRSPVELDQKCLSCSGNANYYNQFFKMACLTYVSSPVKIDSHTYQRSDLLERIQIQLQELSDDLSKKEIKQKKVEQPNQLSKIDRYQSQIMMVPSRDSKSSSDNYLIRNISTSQEIRTQKLQKSNDEPRIINSHELIEGLMTKNRNRLFGRRKSFNYGDHKKGNSKQRVQYMINVGSYFRELRKQNASFIKQ